MAFILGNSAKNAFDCLVFLFIVVSNYLKFLNAKEATKLISFYLSASVRRRRPYHTEQQNLYNPQIAYINNGTREVKEGVFVRGRSIVIN